jgi:hypothetical protein
MAVHDRDRAGWTRRAVLGAASGAVAGVVSGCSWLETDPPPPLPPDPLEQLLATARALAERYQQVSATHPDLAGRLRPLHRAHLAHVETLLRTIGRPELAAPTGASGAWATPLEGTARPDPDRTADPLAELRAAERSARAEAARACLAGPPERAALLGSITAARASHAEVLDAAE